MKNLKLIIIKIGYWITVTSLLLVAGITAAPIFDTPNGIKLYTVQSGSMTPEIPVGSLVITKPLSDYQKNDIITFKTEQDRAIKNPKHTITHRIYEIKTENNKTEYITKGDANNTPDPKPVKKDLILGKVIFTVPFLGFPISFAKTKKGFISLIVIPATIIIYSEVLKIKNEIAKIFQEKKKKKIKKE